MAIVIPITTAFNSAGLDKAVREIKRAEGSFQKFSVASNILSASLVSTGKSLTRNITVPLGILSIAINKSINDASNFEEAQSKVNAVFGEQAKTVTAWSKTMSSSFGVSQRAALEAAGTYGNLFQAFGIGRKEAAEMSTEMVELAADMASFNNSSIEEALTAIRSGLSGETEPLKRYGVALNDIRLKQTATNLGLYNGVGALTVAAKAQAAYVLILKDTALQQGDVQRTAGGLANQKKFLAAQVEDLSGSFGAVFMPIMINLVGVLRHSVLPQIQKFIEAFKTLSPQAIVTGIQIGLFAAALGPLLIIIGYVIKAVHLLAQAFVLLTKRIVLIPLAISYIIVAMVKVTDASMTWGEATYKVLSFIVRIFSWAATAITRTINNMILGPINLFRNAFGKTAIEIKENFDFNETLDSAKTAFQNFSNELKKDQADMSLIVEEAKALANSVGGSDPKSVAGGTNKASEALSNFNQQLDKAKQTLTDARNRFDEFAKSIAGTVRSILNFGTAADAESGTFIENIVGQAEKAKAFGERIRKLIGMGLSESALREVLDAGADAGTKIADEIIAGGATVVDQVNTLLDATQSLADEIGLVGATQFYDAGIKQGEALVQGVVDAITAAGFVIDASGNITNPNAVSNAITTGGPTAGATGGAPTTTRSSTPVLTPSQQNALNKLKSMPMFANGGVVTRPTIGMVGEAGPEAIIPLNKLGKSGAVYNINVNAGIGTDGAQVGREIVDAIRRFERASGPVFASA